ncbi:RHS repeat-associated core domain-containing protein, partial [uncultured Winogradskyella sp.]|uniref:RHS repeat protein n=1 Tax=uncultured Winogradskyella sp. TaxID=395353 RepID=UPI0030DA8669
WLKKINNPSVIGNDLFAFALKYNDSNIGDALFNGNISQTFWKTKNLDQSTKAYTYSYDDLNRLTNAIDYTGKFNTQNISYDKNGNILTLIRKGHIVNSPMLSNNSDFGNMDNLDYTYEAKSNKLKKVLDNGNDNHGFMDGANAATEYFYDSNGNMVVDINKGIANITYNHLNLPEQVFLSGGNIQYIYDATGIKQKKIVSTGTTTEYAGNYIYQDGNLKMFSHSEGYAEPATVLARGGILNFDYVYQYKDHLGNIRLSYKDINPSTNVNLDDDFNSTTDGWSNPGTGSVNNNNQKLNVNIANRWNSSQKNLAVTPGVPIRIEFDFERGNMEYPTFFVKERINGVWESNSNRDAIYNIPDGHNVLDLTLTGDFIKIYFEKSNASDNGTLTTCYVDNFKLTQIDLEILEENNYYPFGLKHKGYNNVINGTDHKYGFQEQEENEELGLNWISFKWRNHDPAIGRFMNIDPLTEDYMDWGPYVFSGNRVIDSRELEGLEPVPVNRPAPRPRFNRNRQLYQRSITNQRADFRRETTYRFKKSFQAHETRSVKNARAMINKYNLSPSETTSSIGTAPKSIQIMEKTLDLLDNLKETMKVKEFRVAGEGNLVFEMGGDSFKPSIGFDGVQLTLLENQFNKTMGGAYSDYLNQANDKENGFIAMSQENFELMYKLQNGPSPFDLIRMVTQEAANSDNVESTETETVVNEDVHSN